MNMILIVTGDRDWHDVATVVDYIKTVNEVEGIEFVVEGECNSGRDPERNADKIARMAAIRMEIPVIAVPARWKTHSKAAGPIRNLAMLSLARKLAKLLRLEIRVAAFHRNLKGSKGTRHMVTQAQDQGIRVDWYDGHMWHDGFKG